MSCDALTERVRRFTAPLVQSGARLLLAVSGGGDSCALMAVMHRLQERLGISVLAAAHVNHGLRGAASDADEAHVRSLAVELGMTCHCTRLVPKSGGGTGVEAWARGERYRYFDELKSRHRYTLVATGHTADDQVETLVMRLQRGCWLRGIMGIHALRDDGVLRPLLLVGRGELRDWLRQQSIGYREDASNAEREYARNRVRQDCVEVLGRVLPGSVATLATAVYGAQRLFQAAQPLVNEWVATYASYPSDQVCRIQAAASPDERFRHGLAEILHRFGIAHSRRHMEDIVSLAGSSEGIVLLPGGWLCEAFRGEIEIRRQGGVRSESLWCSLDRHGRTLCPDGAVIECREEQNSGHIGSVQTNDPWTAFLDADGCPGELVYRSSRPGDMFVPFGRQQLRPLHVFLKSQGVRRDLRARMPVVATSEGEVIWIPGLRATDRFHVVSDTRRVLCMRCSSPGQ